MSPQPSGDLVVTMIQELRSTLMERMDRTDRNVAESFHKLQQEISAVTHQFSDLDKQIALINERQNRIGDLEKDIAACKAAHEHTTNGLDARVLALESDSLRMAGTLRVIKWLGSIAGGGGMLKLLVDLLSKGG